MWTATGVGVGMGVGVGVGAGVGVGVGAGVGVGVGIGVGVVVVPHAAKNNTATMTSAHWPGVRGPNLAMCRFPPSAFFWASMPYLRLAQDLTSDREVSVFPSPTATARPCTLPNTLGLLALPTHPRTSNSEGHHVGASPLSGARSPDSRRARPRTVPLQALSTTLTSQNPFGAPEKIPALPEPGPIRWGNNLSYSATGIVTCARAIITNRRGPATAVTARQSVSPRQGCRSWGRARRREGRASSRKDRAAGPRSRTRTGQSRPGPARQGAGLPRRRSPG